MDLIEKFKEFRVDIDFGDLDPDSDILFEHYLVSKFKKFDPLCVAADVSGSTNRKLPLGRQAWNYAGDYFLKRKSFPSALAVFESLFDYLSSDDCRENAMGKNRRQKGFIPYKGDALRGMSLAFKGLGMEFLANRAVVLALIEEIMDDDFRDGGFTEQGSRSFNNTMLLNLGFREKDTHALRKEIKGLVGGTPLPMMRYPDYVLQHLDESLWLKRFPSESELLVYRPNLHYLSELIAQSNSKQTTGRGVKSLPGEPFEFLAQYLFQLIPGCRAARRRVTNETDFDVWCQFEGVMHDFRRELGHYWLIECKNWKKPVGFTEVAKFALVLVSVNCKFGVMFARKGISKGISGFEDAARARVKLYQNAGIVIAVIEESDLDRIIKGESLIDILRESYEEVRFDFSRSKRKAENGASKHK